jgi:hypothetical protein
LVGSEKFAELDDTPTLRLQSSCELSGLPRIICDLTDLESRRRYIFCHWAFGVSPCDAPRRLLQLDVGRANYVAPLLGFFAHELSEISGRAANPSSSG